MASIIFLIITFLLLSILDMTLIYYAWNLFPVTYFDLPSLTMNQCFGIWIFILIIKGNFLTIKHKQ